MVTAAVSGPRIQSDSETGSKRDSSVGPGVGSRDSTVHFARTSDPLAGAASKALVAVGSETSAWVDVSAAGCVATVFAVATTTSVGVVLWQAANTRDKRMNEIKVSFLIVQGLSVMNIYW